MEILFEDNHIIAINKSVADIVQTDKTNDISLEELLKLYIKQKYNKPGDAFIGVVHRIDRPVSGLVLFARTTKALARLNEMFQNKEVEKTYWAIVKNKPSQVEGTLIHYLTRDTKKNKAHAYNNEVKDSKRSVLHYKHIASSDVFHLLEIKLETGRHHQIRCQLSKIGCPIRGDLKYGFPRSNPDGGISLHSRNIKLIHPVKNEAINIVAPTPPDKLWDFFVNAIEKR